MSDVAITFAVLAAIVVLFVWGGIPVEVVAVGAALVLWASGVLTLEQSVAGFGDPVVLFIAALFVVSEALDSTGVTTWAGRELVVRAGSSRTRLLVLMMLVVAGLTALVTVNAAVAALLPVVVITATRLGLAPSKLLIPLCFGAHAGSQLALTGSNVNLLVAEAALDHGGQAFGFLEFALNGIPLLAGTILLTALVGDRLLPVRSPATISVDLSEHARTLMREYGLDEAAGERALFDREHGLAEIVVPPRSPFVGETVFQGMETEVGDLVVAAIRELRPRVVVCPPAVDHHPDHMGVAELVRQSFYLCGIRNFLPELPPWKPKALLHHFGTRPMQPQLVVDVSDVIEGSREAHIGFRWVELAELDHVEIRPAPIADLLRSGIPGPELAVQTEGFS